MGLFDFLKGDKKATGKASGDKKSVPPAGDGKKAGDKSEKKVQGLTKTATDKRAQSYDRQEAMHQLVEIGSVDAAAVLLKRFSFAIDPSITDQEEKELAFRGIVATGKDVVPAVRDYCEKAEVLTWPIKVLRELCTDDEYREELLELAATMDTEYARNVEPKIQVIDALGEVPSEEVRETLERFLEDVNETVRFKAVQSLFDLKDEGTVPGLVKFLGAEESVRIKNKVAEGFAAAGWKMPENLRESAAAGLRDAYTYEVTSDGSVKKSR